MATAEKLSTEDVNVIILHNSLVMSAANAAILKYKQIPPANMPEHVVDSIIYWENVVSAMKYSNALAQQRLLKVTHNGR